MCLAGYVLVIDIEGTRGCRSSFNGFHLEGTETPLPQLVLLSQQVSADLIDVIVPITFCLASVVVSILYLRVFKLFFRVIK